MTNTSPHTAPADLSVSSGAAARRSNADYRWTVPKVRAFMEALAVHGSVAEAARAVGMSRQSAYRLRARLAGGPFAEGFELARERGLERRVAQRQRPASPWDGPAPAVLYPHRKVAGG